MDNETESRDNEAVLNSFEQALDDQKRPNYTLRLYVTGTTSRSIRAIANLRKICEEHLAGRYELEVIDLYQQPHLAEGDQVVAAPTLIKLFPAPLKRIIGDMSNTSQVLVGLDLQHAVEGRRGE